MTEEGLFDGTITTKLETYYVEPVSRYLFPGQHIPTSYKSVVYLHRDVLQPKTRTCASAELAATMEEDGRRTRRQIQYNSKGPPHTGGVFYFDSEAYEIRRANRTDIIVKRTKQPESSKPQPKVLLGAGPEDNLLFDDDFRAHVHKRGTVDPKKTTCMLYLQADHLFFQKYGTEEACIEVMTRHVQRVNAIYKITGNMQYRYYYFNYFLQNPCFETSNPPNNSFSGFIPCFSLCVGLTEKANYLNN